MKTCVCCNKTKAPDHFYVVKGVRMGKCKECTKAAVRENYRNNWEHYVTYERIRELSPERQAQKKLHMQKHRQLNQAKYKARNAVSNAIRDGRLVKQPCEKCGTTRLVQAHHRDYTKPLDVHWMCRPCHMNDHGKWSAERVMAGGEPF